MEILCGLLGAIMIMVIMLMPDRSPKRTASEEQKANEERDANTAMMAGYLLLRQIEEAEEEARANHKQH
ncbi:MAG TPA: hypothetical protein VGK87_00300 [Anaerolineae bacterium]|jgi:hypothetical protein